MHKKIILPTILTALLLAACGDGGKPTPKPTAYIRIDLPEASYSTLDTAVLPFSFSQNSHSQIVIKQNSRQECWADVTYPEQNGVVFLTYRRLDKPDDLKGQVDTAYRLLEQHFDFSSGVEEQQYADPEHHVYATTYHIKGNKVASTYQFWATDSVRHFLRGALYINESPNNDSLAPVLNYLQTDVNHLIETLRWK
ncbi:MAG: hypothetical protein K5650_05120 [Bacteroidales bacterium]|nr:hypothetical protein [Bacteroidales bacterium]